MPPTTSRSAAKSGVESNDLRGLLEREQLPGGRADLPEPLVADSQRERILNAMAEACASNGYVATTIGDIVELAGVSRATFYELFKDKEDCLRAAMELMAADVAASVGEAYSPDKPWASMVRDTAAVFLGLLASRPDFARMALVEAPAAGGRSMEMYASGKRVLQSLLDRGRTDPVEEQGVPSSASRGSLAAAESLVVGQILAGNTERLPELLPDVVYILTIPYLGQDEALRQSREAESSVRSGAG
ncbi:MAG TPA: TetR/AcrR family transcriptional regulator [Solirubrobacterales bacterium]|nr:TetR/AcrR family transcriptional regulator [Solirubrobacterales bacterium]